jgi:very-short-patch-repair endonuclease
MDGKEQMGSMMARMSNPPRNGEGDRAKRGGGGFQTLQRPVVYSARKLRRKMTLPEILLWEQVRANKIGVKFRRQHPIGAYVADFYCAAVKLVIEIDGGIHGLSEVQIRDQDRDTKLNHFGYRVMRFSDRAIFEDLETVVGLIEAFIRSP